MCSFLVPRRLSRPSPTLYSRAGLLRVHDFLIFVFPPYSWFLVALASPPHLPDPPSLKFRRKALCTYSLYGLIYVFWQCHGEDWRPSPSSLLLKYSFIKKGEGSDTGENENGDYRAGEPNFNRAKLILFILLLSFTCFPIVTRSSASDFCSMTEISGVLCCLFLLPCRCLLSSSLSSCGSRAARVFSGVWMGMCCD